MDRPSARSIAAAPLRQRSTMRRDAARRGHLAGALVRSARRAGAGFRPARASSSPRDLFFSKAAVVTFGGAYAVLPYISQEAVDRYGWLKPAEMLDGLGMAETTPGPLIMVVQFVGFLGAYRNPGELPPLAAGVLGSLVTVWVTFVPCFLYIFVGAPYIERLRANKWLSCALSAITAAVVGVVLNLAIWFAIHMLFGNAGEIRYAPLHLRWYQPDWRAFVAERGDRGRRRRTCCLARSGECLLHWQWVCSAA